MENRLTDAELEQIAEDLLEFHRDGSLTHALALGGLVVDKVFGGDLERWRKRATPSVNKLAKLVSAGRPVSISSTLLRRSIHVYEMDRRLHLRKMANVTFGHAWAVHNLPHNEQLTWLEQVRDDGLSIAELEQKLGRKPRTNTRAPRDLDSAFRDLQAEHAKLLASADAAAADRLEEIARWATEAAAALRAAAASAVGPAVEPAVEPLPPEPAAPPPPPPADVDFLLTDEKPPPTSGVTVGVCRFVLAGFYAPDVDDVHAFMDARFSRLPIESPEQEATMVFPHHTIADHLDWAEQGRHLHLRFDPGLTGTLSLCVGAQLVAKRPELARRTTVDLGDAVPLSEALPLVRQIWGAFHAKEPGPWYDLRQRVPACFVPAFDAWLRELPDATTGRSASQDRLLVAARDGLTAGQAVRRVAEELGHALDETVVEHNLLELVLAGAIDGPTIAYLNDHTLDWPAQQKGLAKRLALTPLGDELLAGRDFVPVARKRHWGGTTLENSKWRFDRVAGKLLSE